MRSSSRRWRKARPWDAPVGWGRPRTGQRPSKRFWHAGRVTIAAMERLVAISHGAPAAALILLVIVVASLFVLLVAPRLLERAVLRPYWLVPRREYATLLTSGFLHADLAHLLFNAFTFWAFAFGLERRIGSTDFVALYAVGLLASDAGTWL